MGSEVSKRKKKVANVVGICVCSALIIFAFCGQYFQSFLREVANFFVGCFGMSFYGIMAAIIVSCSFSLAGKKIKIPAKYLAHFVLLFVFTVLIVHVSTTRYLPTDLNSFVHYVYHFYDGVPTFGGLIFGIIAFALEKAITVYGLYVLLVGMIIFDVTMIGLFFYNYNTGKLTLEAKNEQVYDDVPTQAPAEETTPFSGEDQRQKAISLLFDQQPTVYPESVEPSAPSHFDYAPQSGLNADPKPDRSRAESILFGDITPTQSSDSDPRTASFFDGQRPVPPKRAQTYFSENTQQSADSEEEFVVRGYYEQQAEQIPAVEDTATPNNEASGLDAVVAPDVPTRTKTEFTPVDQGYWQPTETKRTVPTVDVDAPVRTEQNNSDVFIDEQSTYSDSYRSEELHPAETRQTAPAWQEEKPKAEQPASSYSKQPVASVTDSYTEFADYNPVTEVKTPEPEPEEVEDENEIVPVEREEPVEGGMQVAMDFVSRKELKEQQSKIHKYMKYNKPPVELLDDVTIQEDHDSSDREAAAQAIIDKLSVFNIKIEVADIIVGPSITRYMFRVLSQKTRMGDFKQYSDDIKACIEAADDIRIEAPVHGTNLVGIEVANKTKAKVVLRSLLESKAFLQAKGNLVFAIGQEITGKVVCQDLSEMPHLLIAGTTGSGKSVCLNCLIVSMIYRYGPEYVRFLMVDPKYVELSRYNGIPHMLTTEAITNVTDALAGMDYLINEMDARYQLFRSSGVGNISEYNARVNPKLAQKMPYLVFVVDELADLMSAKKKDFETKLGRLAQKSRAAGIHIVLATQRPDVNVITGTIKANLPCRMALKVASQYDSSTIIGGGGAEKLLGRGDMLFMGAGSSDLERIQGAYISNDEIRNLVEYTRSQNEVYYDTAISDEIFVSRKMAEEAAAEAQAQKDTSANKETQIDPFCKKALRFWLEKNGGRASIASIQRSLAIGFNRAGRIMDTLQRLHYVEEPSASESSNKPLMVLVTLDQLDELFPDLEG